MLPSGLPALALQARDERQLIKRFLDRRDVLSFQRRAELAHQIASRLRDRVPIEMQKLDDEALLERL